MVRPHRSQHFLPHYKQSLQGIMTLEYVMHLVCYSSRGTSSLTTSPSPPPAAAAASSSGLFVTKSICRFKLKCYIRPKGHKHHRIRSKLGTEWKKNQLCQNPLLTISSGEGAFSCFCCAWLFWRCRPRQLGLFVWQQYLLQYWLSTPLTNVICGFCRR